MENQTFPCLLQISSEVNINLINPLTDSRWEELVARHPQASAFHRRGWLQALAQTYGYEPLALTSSGPGETLRDGVVLCKVSSWITGTRLVSLPFADHCEPLLSEGDSGRAFTDWLRAECDRQKWKYIELRPLTSFGQAREGWQASASYYFHMLDLRPGLEDILRAMHKDSIQRRIRHAEKEKFEYEAGNSEPLVDELYRLLLMTRRRHRLLPQPRNWFRNLVEGLQESVRIRVVRKDGKPVAGILALSCGNTVIYKYGCSDERHHRLGGMPFLFWKLIQESKAAGAESIDFGRSDLDNPGLMTFKDRFGTTKRMLTYYRHDNDSVKSEAAKKAPRWNSQPIRQFVSMLPDAVLSTASRFVYRHVG